MKIVEDFNFIKIIPFTFCETNSRICHDWLNDLYDFEFSYACDEVPQYFLSDLKHLYYPFVSRRGFEFAFEFNMSEEVSLTCEEFKKEVERSVLKNEDFKELLLNEADEYMYEDIEHFCFKVKLQCDRMEDCIDTNTFSSKWSGEVAKFRLTNKGHWNPDFVGDIFGKAIIDGRMHIIRLDPVINLRFFPLYVIKLSVCCSYDSKVNKYITERGIPIEEFDEKSKDFEHYLYELYSGIDIRYNYTVNVFSTKYMVQYINSLELDKNVYKIFNRLNIDVELF